MQPRLIVALVLALAYGYYRMGPTIPVVPAPAPVVVTAPFPEVAAVARQMNSSDRGAVASGYEILARAVAADPEADPAFPDVAAVRRAHRAALLVLWRGVLDNQPGQVAGLRDALESAVNSRVGSDDVPLTPAIRADVVRAFADVAESIK